MPNYLIPDKTINKTSSFRETEKIDELKSIIQFAKNKSKGRTFSVMYVQIKKMKNKVKYIATDYYGMSDQYDDLVTFVFGKTKWKNKKLLKQLKIDLRNIT